MSQVTITDVQCSTSLGQYKYSVILNLSKLDHFSSKATVLATVLVARDLRIIHTYFYYLNLPKSRKRTVLATTKPNWSLVAYKSFTLV